MKKSKFQIGDIIHMEGNNNLGPFYIIEVTKGAYVMIDFIDGFNMVIDKYVTNSSCQLLTNIFRGTGPGYK